MQVIRGTIPQRSLSFYNKKTHSIQSNIWDELESGLWRKYNVDNRLYNDELNETNQSKWRPVFPDIFPIYPGFHWEEESQSLKDTFYRPNLVEATYESFMSAAEMFFHQFDGKHLGVHLSGGLDSSLIICLLNHFGIPFELVGLQSNRYEFRTERVVQDKLASLGKRYQLIDLDLYPFYSNLDKTPKHQIPDSYIKMNEADGAMASEFERLGVDIVLSGQGGDSLLTEDFRNISQFKGFNINNEFTIPWEEDLLYAPRGIKLVSFFSDTNIIDQICSLRIGQGQDALKWWTRSFFKDLLPRELSEYAYFGDFFGHSVSGLEMAKPTIKLLFEEAFELIKHPIFSPQQTKAFLNEDILSFGYKEYCAFGTKVSIAVWLHSLFRKDN